MNKVVCSPTNIVYPAPRRAAVSFSSLNVIAALTTQLNRPARCETIASNTRAIRTSGNM